MEEPPMTVRELRPLGPALGTEAIGVDLSKPLDAETFAWIEAAFAEHPVLVFRDQDLGPGELAAFGRCFGKPKIHSLVDYRHPEFPEVSWLTNVDKDGNIVSGASAPSRSVLDGSGCFGGPGPGQQFAEAAVWPVIDELGQHVSQVGMR